MSDETNPDLMFQTTDTELLTRIAKGHINPVHLALDELARRGLGPFSGEWVGFEEARALADKLQAGEGSES